MSEAAFIKAFQTIMDQDEFSGLRGISERKWRLKDKKELTHTFIQALQKEYIRIRKK
jgi:hypothetical protein